MLLVHGLGGPAMWERVTPLLAAGHDVIVPHLPGFGESPPAGLPLSADDHALVLGRLLDEAGTGDVTVVGISYGGEIAAILAALLGAARPDRIRSLVLICPTGSRPHSPLLRTNFAQRMFRPFIRWALTRAWISDTLSRRSFFAISSRPQDLVRRYLDWLRQPGRADVLADTIGDVWSRGESLPGVVGRLMVPVRVVWGADDRTIPAGAARALEAARPGMRMTVIPRCGHSVPLEKPEELSAIIAEAVAAVQMSGPDGQRP